MRLVGILVHGTFAAPRANAKQWYELPREQPDSFIARLESALRHRGEILPEAWHVFTWSGANTHSERVGAAEKLYNLLREVLTTSPDAEFLLIAHSHGGNVALKSLELLWRRNPEADLAFEEILRSIGTQSLINRRSRLAFIETSPHFSGLSAAMRSFLENSVLVLAILCRLSLPQPPSGADPEALQSWVNRASKSAFLRRWREPFSLRWSMERRPRADLVTMGTPYYQKTWNRPAWVRTSAGQFIGLMTGLTLVALAFLAPSLIRGEDTGPAMELANYFMGAAFVLIIARFAIDKYRHDTNIYFNIPQNTVAGPIARPWRLCVIQSGFLDEALLALSAEPLLFAELGPLLKRPLGPRLTWTMTPDVTGEFAWKVPFNADWYLTMLRKITGLVLRWIYNITIGSVLRLVGWFVTIATHRYLLKILLRSISSSGFGIPDHEFRAARIRVIGNPALEFFFEQEMWVATEALIAEAPVRPTAADRQAKWGFLSSDQLLEQALPSSQIWRRIITAAPRLRERFGLASQDPTWLQRLSLALEERLREAAGLVPLNHSAYYSNTKVIDRIADFVANQPGVTPQLTQSEGE